MLVQSHEKGLLYLPFIEQVTYCPFETVIDRTATDDDSQRLNAECIIVKSSEPLHARRRRERDTEGRIKEIVSVRSLEGGDEELQLGEKNRLFQQGELGLTDPTSLGNSFA